MTGAALALSCVRNEYDLGDRTIAFNPVASKQTRAIISGTTYPLDVPFAVSAYHNGTAAYFENLTASYSNSQWATSPSQYWPLNGSLKFNAYSPATAGLSITSSGINADNYTITTAAQMTTDLCYASWTETDCAAHHDTAPLDFNHALSQVVFRVKAAGYYTTALNVVTINVNSLTLNNIYSQGDFDTEATPMWEVDNGSAHTYTLSNTSTALTYNNNNEPNVLELCSYLFIPQTLATGENGANLSVTYSVSQTISATTYTLNNSPANIALGGTISEWEPGKKYIYTLNISLDNHISITATADEWTTSNQTITVEEN